MGGRLFHLHERRQSNQLLRRRGNCHRIASRSDSLSAGLCGERQSIVSGRQRIEHRFLQVPSCLSFILVIDLV